ncbi:hypothetical protein EA462_00150 [Natrarchaeobius halalkaliphilus]|uniref:Uncharacterized protein n=1 Tax=Natrarchaeobius halalkaliphilus TaxID=1679091 RepID=A0A3N6LXY1_9EURY|nr:hypothetical protein [Natrarchaeobius halalkaliphilus]RQG92684.1 hypothetical protein EA462_00150 [Natrarchaeobius halalkaliphilus]
MNLPAEPITIDGIAFVLILLVLPVVSYGTMAENELVWGFGLMLLLLGSLIPLVMEFWIREDEEE